MTEIVTTRPVRYVADYQMFGDMEGVEWANLVLGKAKEDGRLADFKVLNSLSGTFGIQFISFTADLDAPVTEFRTNDEAIDYGVGVLNEIVGDSDVEVRWAALAPEEN